MAVAAGSPMTPGGRVCGCVASVGSDCPASGVSLAMGAPAVGMIVQAWQSIAGVLKATWMAVQAAKGSRIRRGINRRMWGNYTNDRRRPTA